jgi:hypothetical protein
MRLPLPLSSVNRYQYSRAGVSPPMSARHVQSDSASTVALADARIFSKARSSETSIVNRASVRPSE